MSGGASESRAALQVQCYRASSPCRGFADRFTIPTTEFRVEGVQVKRNSLLLLMVGAALLALSSRVAWAGAPPAIPTLSDWSMLGLVALLAFLGVVILVKRARLDRKGTAATRSTDAS